VVRGGEGGGGGGGRRYKERPEKWVVYQSCTELELPKCVICERI